MLARLPRTKHGEAAIHNAMLLATALHPAIRLYDPRRISGTSWRFRLLPTGRRYLRLNSRLTRHVNALCWHGFRDWMFTFFDILPEAQLITRAANYRGRGGFLENHEETASHNIGSRFEPCFLGDACHCDEDPEDIVCKSCKRALGPQPKRPFGQRLKGKETVSII